MPKRTERVKCLSPSFPANQKPSRNTLRKQEAEKLGLGPYGDNGQEEYKRCVLELEQKSLDHPEIDWEVKYWELAGHLD